MLVLLGIAALSQMAPTCGNDFGHKGPGEPCTRDTECEEDLLCNGGMCEDPVDGGFDDSGPLSDAPASD